MSNKSEANIPWWLIILSYVFFWPLELILTFLKIFLPTINSAVNNQSKNNQSSSTVNINNYNSSAQYKQTGSAQDVSEGYKQYIENQNSLYKRQTGKSGQQEQGASSAQQQSGYSYNYSYQYGGKANKTGNIKNMAKSIKKIGTSPATVLLTILGFIFMIPGAVMGLQSIVNLFSGAMNIPLFIQAGVFVTSGVASFLAANAFSSRNKLFARYQTVIGKRSAVYLPKLASVMDVRYKKACRDIQIMIDKGYLGADAYIDMETRNLMMRADATPEQLPDYMTQTPAVEEQPFEVEEEPEIDETEGNKEFRTLLRQIRAADVDIENEEVSQKIRRIEDITRVIFGHVEANPAKLPQIRTFMNYFLPTTLKLLKSYSQLEKLDVNTDNINSARDNIEKILDMLVAGFEQQLDQLYRTEELDISSDINVLEQMMFKDGLASGGAGDINAVQDEAEEDPFAVDDFNAFSDDLSGGAAVKEAPENKDKE